MGAAFTRGGLVAMLAVVVAVPYLQPNSARVAERIDSDAQCAALAAHYRPLAEREARKPVEHINPVAAETPVPSAADRAAVDGNLLLTFGGDRGALRVIDTAGGHLRVLAQKSLPGGRVLALGHRRALIIGDETTYNGFVGRPAFETVLSMLDLSAPAAPRLLGTERVSGELLDARLSAGVVRVAIRYAPPILSHLPRAGETDAQVQTRDLAAARKAPGAAYLPHRQITGAAGKVSADGPLLDCGDLVRPAPPTDLGATTVLTFDAAGGFATGTATGVADYADFATAGPSAVYLAAFDRGAPDARRSGSTLVHGFATAGPTTTYRATGSVPGLAAGPASLSVRDGVLRVALGVDYTHIAPEGKRARGVGLAAFDADTLKLLGSVRGVGRSDLVNSVEWIDDRAVLVSDDESRQLFDVSRPTAPRAAGRLRLPGNPVLVPVGDRRALAVGSVAGGLDAVPTVRQYDFADAAHPTSSAATPIGGAGGHPAALFNGGWVPSLRLAMIPFDTVVRRSSCCSYDVTRAALFEVASRGAPRLIGTVDAGGYPRQVLPLGRRLVLISDGSVVLVDPRTGTALDRLAGTAQKG